MENKDTFSLVELFTNADFNNQSEREIYRVFLHPFSHPFWKLATAVIQHFSKNLGIPFGESNEIENNSPVCYAQSDEVRADYLPEQFPLFFNKKDVLNYVCGVLLAQENIGLEIPYPNHQFHFWTMVNTGNKYLCNQISKPLK